MLRGAGAGWQPGVSPGEHEGDGQPVEPMQEVRQDLRAGGAQQVDVFHHHHVTDAAEQPQHGVVELVARPELGQPARRLGTLGQVLRHQPRELDGEVVGYGAQPSHRFSHQLGQGRQRQRCLTAVRACHEGCWMRGDEGFDKAATPHTRLAGDRDRPAPRRGADEQSHRLVATDKRQIAAAGAEGERGDRAPAACTRRLEGPGPDRIEQLRRGAYGCDAQLVAQGTDAAGVLVQRLLPSPGPGQQAHHSAVGRLVQGVQLEPSGGVGQSSVPLPVPYAVEHEALEDAAQLASQAVGRLSDPVLEGRAVPNGQPGDEVSSDQSDGPREIFPLVGSGQEAERHEVGRHQLRTEPDRRPIGTYGVPRGCEQDRERAAQARSGTVLVSVRPEHRHEPVAGHRAGSFGERDRQHGQDRDRLAGIDLERPPQPAHDRRAQQVHAKGAVLGHGATLAPERYEWMVRGGTRNARLS